MLIYTYIEVDANVGDTLDPLNITHIRNLLHAGVHFRNYIE